MLSTKSSQDILIPIKPIKIQAVSLKEEDETTDQFIQEMVSQTQQDCENQRLKTKQACEQLLLDTKKEADEIKQKSLEEGKKEGYEVGFSEGVKKGEELVNTEFSQLLNTFKSSCLTMQEEYQDYLNQSIGEVVTLTKSIVEKLTFQTLSNSEVNILPLVEAQLKSLIHRKQIFMRLHPTSMDYIRAHEATFESLCKEAKFHFIEDATLTDFGCVIETESEIIDLQLDKQIETLFDYLENVVRSR